MEKAFVSGSVVFAVHGSYFIRKPTPKDAQEREEGVARAAATAVEESSATETHSEATPGPETEANPTSTLAVPVEVDVTTKATGEESARNPVAP